MFYILHDLSNLVITDSKLNINVLSLSDFFKIYSFSNENVRPTNCWVVSSCTGIILAKIYHSVNFQDYLIRLIIFITFYLVKCKKVKND